MQELGPGLTTYLTHHIQEEPGYQATHHVDIVDVDESYVYVRKHGATNFHYPDDRPSKDFLRLRKSLYTLDWYLSKGNL